MTTEHFALFGHIISGYAMCESLLKSLLAVVLSADLTTVHALTDRTNGVSLIRVVRALSQEIRTDSVREAIEAVCARLDAVGELRNKIAHSTWMPGTRPDSIRASEVAVRAKGVLVRGFDASEPDYTLQDLNAVAAEVEDISSSILRILREPTKLSRTSY